MIITLLGPPGSGKGTQGKLLSQALGVPHLSTGDMLRDIVASGSDLGARIAAVIDAGHFISDEMARDMVAARLDEPDCAAGLILDGFPRTLPQVGLLSEILSQRGRALDAALLFEVPEEVLIERITGRGDGRADDRPEIIAERLAVFREKTQPVIDAYRATNSLLAVYGDQSPSAVLSQCLESLGVRQPAC